MTSDATQTLRSRWWTVVAGALGCGLGAGVLVLYTFGVFASAMAMELGWSRSIYATALTIFLIASGIGSFSLGPIIERYGVRRPCAALVTLFGLSVMSLAVIPVSPQLVYLTFAVIGFAGSAATAMPYAVAVRSRFDADRGLALGLVNLGSGVGTAVGPFLAATLLGSFGWRGGFVGMGLIGLVPALGLLFLVSDALPARSRSNLAPAASWWAQTSRPEFWLIALPVAGISIATFGVIGTMVPFLKDREVTAATIALVMSCSGIASWVARPIIGYALDRVFGPLVAAAMFVVAMTGLLILPWASSLPGICAAAVLIGFALGSEGDLVTFLVSRYFGPQVYSRVLGAIWVTWAWGGGIGTFTAGATFEHWKTYTPAFLGFAVLLALGTMIVMRLGPYAYPPAGRNQPRFSPAAVSSAPDHAS